MPWLSIIGAVAGPVLGGLMGSDASENAAQAQTDASAAQIAEQKRQYDLSRADATRMYDTSRADAFRLYDQARADQAPYREAGSASVNTLRALMGLGAGPVAAPATGSTTANALMAPAAPPPAAGPAPDSAAIRARLLPQFTTTTAGGTPFPMPANLKAMKEEWPITLPDGTLAYGPQQITAYNDRQAAPRTVVDEAALDAAIQRELAGGIASTGAPAPAGPSSSIAAAPLSTDPYQIYGDAPLLRRFGARDLAADPLYQFGQRFDLNADPVYQSGLKFGLDQGTGAINARAIAGGGYDSGATIKALTRFANDYGSTKAGEAWNRFKNEQNQAYNRFVGDQGNVYNRLAGLAGTGQTSTANTQAAGATLGNQQTAAGANLTNQLGQYGMNAANNISESLAGAGNARAAGIVGGANAWGNAFSGINSGLNNYSSNKILQELLRDKGYGGGWGSFTPYYSGYDLGGGPAYG